MARCAACGLETDGIPTVMLGFYVVHEMCQGVPAGEWVAAEKLRRAAVAVRRARAQLEEARQAKQQMRLEHERVLRDRDFELARARADIAEAHDRVRRLEQTLRELRAPAPAPAAAPRKMPATLAAAAEEEIRRLRTALALTLGVALGRGIYGFAYYFAERIWPEDDTAARYSLLELQ